MTCNRSLLIAALLPLCAAGHLFAQSDTAMRGPCVPPTAIFSSSSPDPARLCLGDVINVNAAASEAAPGRTIEQWVWNYGPSGIDSSDIPFAILEFTSAGVHELTLEVIDDIGCSSGPTSPRIVLVSATPEFSGVTGPLLGCDGDVFDLFAQAEQPPMIGAPEACTALGNSIPLLDTPTPSISTIEVEGQPSGNITDLGQLGDICLEIEHSYVGDLVLTVSCPNGQSVVLHQQGGSGTYLGDANNADGNAIIPGTCFQYCFGVAPEFGTLAQSAVGGTQPNTIPVSQGTAIAPGRYTSIQPLTQLLGCPFNGVWSFSSADLFGADNGYLCGWCISFGEAPDSSYIDQGPVLGATADSSFWSGAGVVNTQPGSATFTPPVGGQTVTYTVIDSYGCEHEAAVDVFIGAQPEVTIVNDPELGLLCAQVTGGPVDLQWSYGGQIVVGAAGACYTPPGPGMVSVTVVNEQGCSAAADFLSTGTHEPNTLLEAGFSIFPNPSNGTFTLVTEHALAPAAELRLMDMAGRVAFARSLGAVGADSPVQLSTSLAPGIYLAEVQHGNTRSAQRVVVH